MSVALRTKLRSLSAVHLPRSFSSSIDDGFRQQPEPIPSRPTRNQSSYPPPPSPGTPNHNRGRKIETQHPPPGETDADLLDFKLGFYPKAEIPKTQPEKSEIIEEKPLSPPDVADEICKRVKETGNQSSYPSTSSVRIPNHNRGRQIEIQHSSSGETDADFLGRFKLGFYPKVEIPKTQPEKSEIIEKKPQLPQDDAGEIFKKMKETGLIRNAVAMIDSLCKDGLVQDAMKLFRLMREKGTIPEVVAYTAVVEGFCRARKLDDAIRIFKKMQSNGVAPNAFSYQVLIQGLCNGKRLDDAYVFTIAMLEAGHSPNLATFTRLVEGYCREKGLEDARIMFDEMRVKGFFVEEKQAKEYLHKNGPFMPSVWDTILGKRASKRSLF